MGYVQGGKETSPPSQPPIFGAPDGRASLYNNSDALSKIPDEQSFSPKAPLLTIPHLVKEWSPKKLRKYAKKYRVQVPELAFVLKYSPNSLHAYVAADFVRATVSALPV